jgi:hypothetical protein
MHNCEQNKNKIATGKQHKTAAAFYYLKVYLCYNMHHL